MQKQSSIILMVLHLIFGLYFINLGINFFETPKLLLDVNNWITLFGGVLIIIGGINYIRAKKKLAY